MSYAPPELQSSRSGDRDMWGVRPPDGLMTTGNITAGNRTPTLMTSLINEPCVELLCVCMHVHLLVCVNVSVLMCVSGESVSHLAAVSKSKGFLINVKLPKGKVVTHFNLHLWFSTLTLGLRFRWGYTCRLVAWVGLRVRCKSPSASVHNVDEVNMSTANNLCVGEPKLNFYLSGQ